MVSIDFFPLYNLHVSQTMPESQAFPLNSIVYKKKTYFSIALSYASIGFNALPSIELLNLGLEKNYIIWCETYEPNSNDNRKRASKPHEIKYFLMVLMELLLLKLHQRLFL